MIPEGQSTPIPPRSASVLSTTAEEQGPPIIPPRGALMLSAAEKHAKDLLAANNLLLEA